MIYQTKFKDKDYLMVYTNIQIQENEEVIEVPIVTQVNINKFNKKQRSIIYNKINKLFNHALILEKPKIKKSWWKFW